MSCFSLKHEISFRTQKPEKKIEVDQKRTQLKRGFDLTAPDSKLTDVISGYIARDQSGLTPTTGPPKRLEPLSVHWNPLDDNEEKTEVQPYPRLSGEGREGGEDNLASKNL